MAFKILLHFAAGISKDIHDVGGSKSGNRPPQVFVESATPGVSTQVFTTFRDTRKVVFDAFVGRNFDRTTMPAAVVVAMHCTFCEARWLEYLAELCAHKNIVMAFPKTEERIAGDSSAMNLGLDMRVVLAEMRRLSGLSDNLLSGIRMDGVPTLALGHSIGGVAAVLSALELNEEAWKEENDKAPHFLATLLGEAYDRQSELSLIPRLPTWLVRLAKPPKEGEKNVFRQTKVRFEKYKTFDGRWFKQPQTLTAEARWPFVPLASAPELRALPGPYLSRTAPWAAK